MKSTRRRDLLAANPNTKASANSPPPVARRAPKFAGGADVGAVVVIVRVVLPCALPFSATEAGVNWQDANEGTPDVHAKFTLPVKPLLGVRLIVNVAGAPARMVALLLGMFSE